MPYTVTIYVAASGTPLASGGTSKAGHVYYVTSDGQNKNSFGFAPIVHENNGYPTNFGTTDIR
ncbi:MAG: hypothetical protein H6R05_644 [Burkholderiaceae bacterium]|nr:hypothetical protein [Burkholderiaceae bacterium]